jgi:hypothetical protein
MSFFMGPLGFSLVALRYEIIGTRGKGNKARLRVRGNDSLVREELFRNGPDSWVRVVGGRHDHGPLG